MGKSLKKLFIFKLIITICSGFIVLPFKTFYREEPKIFNTPLDIIKYWDINAIYSKIKIGTSPQDIAIFFNSENFGSNLFYHMCDFPGSSFERKSSSSFKWGKNYQNVNKMKNASLAYETFYLYDKLDTNEMKPFHPIPFVYSDNDKDIQGESYEYHDYTCMNIGLTLGHYTDAEKDSNFIEHLKELGDDVIVTYDHTLEYLSDDEGRIIIGEEPYTYDPEKYKKKNYKLSKGKSGNSRNFNFNFDSIYMDYDGKKHEIETKVGRIYIDKGLIFGPEDYRLKIKELFFDGMGKKCTENTTHDSTTNENFITYFCDKELAENDIKNKFPTLYFKIIDFDKVFELSYKDLFREKNGQLYFLVYFKRNNYYNYFNLKKIFLKKYTFTFNQNNFYIGYTNNDEDKDKGNGDEQGNNDNKSFYKQSYFWVIIGIIALILAILGFFGGKAIYNNVRKKRLNEVDDDNYDYVEPENEDKRLFSGSNENDN